MVVVRLHQPKARTVRWAVIDNGPGMNEEVIEKLFTPYYTTKRAGTGLGPSRSGISSSTEDVSASRAEWSAAPDSRWPCLGRMVSKTKGELRLLSSAT